MSLPQDHGMSYVIPRRARPRAATMLELQWRMHPDISAVVNPFYGGKLRNHPITTDRTLTRPGGPDPQSPPPQRE